MAQLVDALGVHQLERAAPLFGRLFAEGRVESQVRTLGLEGPNALVSIALI